MEHIETFHKYEEIAIFYANRDLKMCSSFGYSKEDVISWALEALWVACLKKDKNLDEKQFMRYLSLRIHGEIIDIIRKDKINFGSKLGAVKMPCFSQLDIVDEEGKAFQVLNSLNGIKVEKSYSSDIDKLKFVLDEELFYHIIQGMTAREKFIVRRKFFEGYKMLEIAKELKISAGLVSNIYVHRIVPKIKSRLEMLT